MTFVETFSPFLLFRLPWKSEDKEVRDMFERQWGNLRKAVLFCLRHHPGQHTPAQLRKTKKQFEAYAFAAQEVWSSSSSVCCHVLCVHARLTYASQ